MDRETLQRIDTLLIDYTCSGIESLGADLIQVVFGKHRLIVWCAWRLSDQGEIVVSSESEGVVQSKIEGLLVGSVVRKVHVRGEFHELRVGFTNDRVLEAFADSEKYENWNLVTGSGEMIIAGPGRLWSWFPQPT